MILPSIHLYVDDLRIPRNNPEKWTIVRDAATAKLLLSMMSEEIVEISLDHDLGNDEVGTGYDVIKFIEEMQEKGQKIPVAMGCHSANPVGSLRIYKAIEAIRRRENYNNMLEDL